MAAAATTKAKKKTWTWRIPSAKEIFIGLATLWVFVAFSSQLRGRDNVLGSIPTFLSYLGSMIWSVVVDSWHALCFFGANVAEAWMAQWGDNRPVGIVLTIVLIGLVVRIIQKGLTWGVKIIGFIAVVAAFPFLWDLVLGAGAGAIVYWFENTRLLLEVVVATFLAFGAILLLMGKAPIHAPKGGGGGGHGGGHH